MIFILGLDGLEYDFVERWNLKSLKQKEYGKLEVPINKRTGVPLSPEVWAAFLTGKYVPGLDFTRTPMIDFILRTLEFMRKHVPVGFGLGKRIRVKAPRSFPKLNEKTFLDHTNSREINVPYYSYDNKIPEIMNRFDAGKLSLKETIREALEVYKEWKQMILDEAGKLEAFDVVFAYTHFPDSIQHLSFTKPSKIEEFYADLDNYVSVLKSRVEASLFLIISDHGFDLETKTHSKHGFYSSNISLNPKPKRITDFYDLVTSRPVR